MAKGNDITPTERTYFLSNSSTGDTRRPRDNHAVFRNALGLAAQGSDDQWAQIKNSIYDILLHRKLVGRLPSSLRKRTKIAIVKQLAAAHPETFSLLKPKSHHQDLIYRIFAYQMAKLRGRVRRREVESPKQTSSPPTTPSPQVTPLQKPTPVGSRTAKYPTRESVVEPPVTEFFAGEPFSTEILGEIVEEALAIESEGAEFLRAESIPAGTRLETPKMVLVSAPAIMEHKEVVITVLVPSVPSFKTMLIKSHLLEDSNLSVSKLFQILKEDGFHCRPEEYVVRDEFGHELASHRHLTTAFQLLANEERLESHWLVLGKDGGLLPSLGLETSGATPSASEPWPFRKGFSGKKLSPTSASRGAASFGHAQAVVDPSYGGDRKIQDRVGIRELL